MKYFIQNLGCQMNLSDSERIQSVLNGLGLEKTDNENEASILGMVACSVRQKAIDRVYSKIHEWNERKSRENLITFVSGCILPSDHEKFLKRFDLLFGLQQLGELPSMLKQYGVATPLSLEVDSGASIQNFWKIKPHYTNTYEAFIPIQNGCDKFCTFCAVPYTRGREVSRPSGEILEEVTMLVRKGYHSITLLGQNVNSYGQDKKGDELSFAQLLQEVGEIGRREKADFWTYFTSPHPRDMTTEVLETVARYPVLAKQIHLPLQSGDDKILIRMNRNYTVERYRDVVREVQRILPEATLFTDVIVGFTGETEEQFQNTRKAMEEFSFQMAYIAQYSPRPGAASARWDDDVPLETKKARLHELTQVLHITSGAYNEKQIGKRVKVLVEKPDRKSGYLAARTEGKVGVRFASQDLSLIGNFVEVEITSFIPLSMEARLV